MGRIGRGAYDYMHERHGGTVVGLDSHPKRVRHLQATGRNVLPGDPSEGYLLTNNHVVAQAEVVVRSEGPGGDAGIRERDIITRLDNKSVASLESFHEIANALPRGRSASVLIVRGERPLQGGIRALRIKHAHSCDTAWYGFGLPGSRLVN